MRLFLPSLLVLAFLAGCASDPTPRYQVTAASTADAGEAARLISAYRVSKGLPPVSADARLNEAAEFQAKAVAAAGQLDHGRFSERMRTYGIAGYAAENLTAGSQNVDGALSRWKASPPHNDNLLLPQARRIGLARADSASGYGRYWALVLSQ